MSEIRKAVKKLHSISAATQQGRHFYRVDRLHVDGYFYGHDKWLNEVTQHVYDVKGLGLDPAYLDVCGQAKASELGVVANYHFTIQTEDRYAQLYSSHRVVGDIFSAFDFNKVVREVRGNGHLLSLTTFMPMAGLQAFNPKCDTEYEQVVYRRLFHQLSKIVGMTRSGGYVLLEMPFQFCGHSIRDFISRRKITDHTSHKWVKAAARKLKCNIRVANTLSGPNWLLCKR